MTQYLDGMGSLSSSLRCSLPWRSGRVSCRTLGTFSIDLDPRNNCYCITDSYIEENQLPWPTIYLDQEMMEDLNFHISKHYLMWRAFRLGLDMHGWHDKSQSSMGEPLIDFLQTLLLCAQPHFCTQLAWPFKFVAIGGFITKLLSTSTFQVTSSCSLQNL